MLITLLIVIPVALIIMVPAHFITSYSVYAHEVFYTITQLFLIFCLLFFILFPFIWGFLNYFLYVIEIDAQHISFHKGILLRKHTEVPYSHIQTISILKDPLMDILGLCSMQIDLVASSEKHPLHISGLSVDQAQYIRTMYLEGTKTRDQLL